MRKSFRFCLLTGGHAMRTLVFLLFCALALAAVPEQRAYAAAAPAPGGACTELGTTLMWNNNMNILACLCDSTPNCTTGFVWKTMAVDVLTNGTFVCPTGQALVGIVKGVAKCIAY
jgi:hypothetical protein